MAKTTLSPQLARAAGLMQQGRTTEAAALCKDVLKRDKRDVDAHQILGLIESMRGRFEEACRWFQRGLKFAPKTPILYCGLAKARTSLGQYDDAVAAYDRALSLEVGYPPAIAGKADALEHRGSFDEARALLAPIVERGEEDGEAAYIYATLLQRSGEHEDAALIVEKHLANPKLAVITRRKLLFAIGKTYDALGRHPDSFAAYEKANGLLCRPFDIAVVREKFARVQRVFAKENLPNLALATNDSELPIFVVSMPRSGSTLVEQILAAHPQVHGAGEIDEMIQRFKELPKEARTSDPYPEAMKKLEQKGADRLGARYVGRIRPLAREASRIVDKNLQNFRLLGLISRILPRSRVIYCRRDPLAVCYSCYTLPLSTVALPYTTDLANLGAYYVEYERHMQFWIDTLDLPILTVQYEDLVQDQERISRDIIAFAGLEWDDACLSFHKAERDVATASYDQVRRPMYKTAMKRYAPYWEELAPLRAALATGGVAVEEP